MKKTAQTTPHTAADILEELKSLVHEAEALVSDSVSSVNDDVVANLRARYEAAQTRLADAYANARTRTKDAYQTAKTRTMATASSADGMIRENPYSSIAVAAGAGLLVGLLVASRNSSSSSNART